MIACFLTLAVPVSIPPQIVPAAAEAVVISGVRRLNEPGRSATGRRAPVGRSKGSPPRLGPVDLTALALGNGGVAIPGLPGVRRAPGLGRSSANLRGEHVTIGGVRVRALAAGVKLDFPNGAELLVSPTCRIHLRSGEQSLPYFAGVQLVLADGSVVSARRGSRRGRKESLASVDVETNGRVHRIWSAGRRVVNASHTGPFRGGTVLVLGDGRCVFQADLHGPVLALERVVCPKALGAKYPKRRVVILADVLAVSLKLLPDHAPRRSVQFPQVEEAASRFAALSTKLFRGNIQRPLGAVGEAVVSIGRSISIEAGDRWSGSHGDRSLQGRFLYPRCGVVSEFENHAALCASRWGREQRQARGATLLHARPRPPAELGRNAAVLAGSR